MPIPTRPEFARSSTKARPSIRGLGLWLALLALPIGSRPATAQPPPDAPTLVVLLVVDQMRGDAIDRFQHEWSGGLRRLLDEGAHFAQAKYTYFGTLTCAGHATIATGTIPATHGIILDGWWDHSNGRRVRCTADATAEVVRYGSGGSQGHGPGTLEVPTLADELRVQQGGANKVASFSIKARAAIPLAGQRANAIAWFEDGNAWVTSTAFTDAPVPFVASFVKANPVEADFGATWRPSLPVDGSERHGDDPDDLPFLRVLAGEADAPDADFYTEWKRSPFADEYVARMAMAAVDELELGAGRVTDLLAIGFSAADYAGHDFGPFSPEVRDLYGRLDRTIGRLLEHLDRRVGRDRYVVALSADHGAGPSPEQAKALGLDAGRIDRSGVVEAVNQALEPILGPGPHAAGLTHIELYFSPGTYDRLLGDPRAMEAALEALRAIPGIARVYRRETLLGGPHADPLTRLVARSYYPGRSGDLVIVPKPYWYTWVRVADHGTGYDYDTRVPLLLMGRGIRPGRYWTDAAPSDIAPTLAFLTGTTLARTDGRVLSEALTGPSEPR